MVIRPAEAPSETPDGAASQQITGPEDRRIAAPTTADIHGFGDRAGTTQIPSDQAARRVSAVPLTRRATRHVVWSWIATYGRGSLPFAPTAAMASVGSLQSVTASKVAEGASRGGGDDDGD